MSYRPMGRMPSTIAFLRVAWAFWLRVAGVLPPLWRRLHLDRRRRRILSVAGVALALVLQLVLLWLVGQMVDLCIALMELWVELAAKHLEITLDTTS